MKENWGKFVLVVDGSIPTKDDGIYCMVAGKTLYRDGAFLTFDYEKLRRDVAETAARLTGR